MPPLITRVRAVSLACDNAFIKPNTIDIAIGRYGPVARSNARTTPSVAEITNTAMADTQASRRGDRVSIPPFRFAYWRCSTYRWVNAGRHRRHQQRLDPEQTHLRHERAHPQRRGRRQQVEPEHSGDGPNDRTQHTVEPWRTAGLPWCPPCGHHDRQPDRRDRQAGGSEHHARPEQPGARPGRQPGTRGETGDEPGDRRPPRQPAFRSRMAASSSAFRCHVRPSRVEQPDPDPGDGPARGGPAHDPVGPLRGDTPAATASVTAAAWLVCNVFSRSPVRASPPAASSRA